MLHVDKNMCNIKILLVGFIFTQNFDGFEASPVGVTHEKVWGRILKMLQMWFHVCQITRYVVRIYGTLLYVGCVVEEILEKGHAKVKWGQILNNDRSA